MSASKPLIGRSLVAGMFLCVTVWLTPLFATVTYFPGDSPSCTLTHTTLATLPANQNRTTIGIGEKVSLAITNWSDPDIEVIDDYPPCTVQDGISSVTWTVSPPTGGGSVFPTAGISVMFTAPLLDSTASATVTARVIDSRWMGIDNYLNKTVSFSILIPTGLSINGIYSDLGLEDLGFRYQAGGPFAGAATAFNTQVLPDSVNFNNVPFREHIPWQEKDPPDGWPNGMPWVRLEQDVSYGVSDHAGTVNWVPDTVSTGETPIVLLAGTSKSFDISIPNQFQGASGWITFKPETHTNAFTGPANTAHVAAEGTPGSEQGPWTK